jgi:four helix bundle protein
VYYYDEFMEKKNVIEEKSFSFALEVIRLCKILQKKREFVVSNQLLKSGTSIGANIAEAQVACSAKEFSSRMSIAAREARETEYWLKLIDASTDIQVDVKESRQRASELVRILISIVKTSRERERKTG